MLVQLVDMTKLSIEHPTLLAQHTQQYIHQYTVEGACNPPFTCEVLIVLGGNIVKSGDWYLTTSYEQGTKKSFGAQGNHCSRTLVPSRRFRLPRPLYRENGSRRQRRPIRSFGDESRIAGLWCA